MSKVKKFFGSTGRFIFVLFILIAAWVFAMFQGGAVSWTIFYCILPFVIYSIVLAFYPLSTIKVERTVRTPTVQNGGKLNASLTVNRNFRFPLLYTVVTEKCSDQKISKLAGNQLKHLFVFGFRKSNTWNYEVSNMTRGEYIFEGVEIEVSDFFGWIRKTHFIPVKHTVLVYPKITDVHYVSIDNQYDRGATVSPYNIVKDTTMATGVRDYQPGDRVTWIHWKSFARTQTLMTKEFEDRRSQELFVVLDGRPSNTFEEQVELAASLIKEISNHQAGIGFQTTGKDQPTFPFIQSEEHVQRVLVHLAKVKPSGDESTGMLPNQGGTLSHGGSIILITGNPDWPFIQSVVQNANNARSVVCFVVVNRNHPVRKTMAEDIRLAKSRGITVHTLTQEQFSEAFKEVARY